MIRSKFLKQTSRCLVVSFILIGFYILVSKHFHLKSKFLKENEKIDWNDYAFIAYEASRVGPGENGSAHNLTDPSEIELNKIGLREEGIATIVSEQVSVQRSLVDKRLPA